MADWTSDTIPKNIMETLVVDDLAVNYEISAGTIQAKNAATAWVNFDGTTTPPTIRDSYNVKDVVRTATGKFDVYFEEEMDNTNYSASATRNLYGYTDIISISGYYTNFVRVSSTTTSSYQNSTGINVQIFGGK